jgi:predicted membrane channel-forming protein YqfA (hemolysin III family)
MRLPNRAFSVFMAVVSFIVASIPAFGIVMKHDITGRVIFVSVWILVGLGWFGVFLHSQRSGKTRRPSV